MPLLCYRRGDLTNFGHVEGLFQDEHAVRRAKPLLDVVPAVIRVCRADNDLDVGIALKDLLDRLQSVPARWHAHIHDGERVRSGLGYRSANHRYPGLPLIG